MSYKLDLLEDSSTFVRQTCGHQISSRNVPMSYNLIDISMSNNNGIEHEVVDPRLTECMCNLSIR